MDHHGQMRLAREAHLIPKGGVLRRTRRKVVMKIETDLTDSHHARMVGKAGHTGFRRFIPGFGIVRMDADRRVQQRRMGFGKRHSLLAAVDVVADDDHCGNACQSRPLQARNQVIRKAFMIEMAVCVDKHGEWGIGSGE